MMQRREPEQSMGLCVLQSFPLSLNLEDHSLQYDGHHLGDEDAPNEKEDELGFEKDRDHTECATERE
jgi:hypothetical protein